MNRKKLLQSKRRGSAMALMMVALVVLLVMGVGLLSLGLHGRILAIRDASEIAARCAADAGLTKALFEMNEKLKVKPWDDSTLPSATNETLPNSDATFSYTVTVDGDSGYAIVSVGKYGQAVKQVSCNLGLEGPFDTAIFGNDEISLKSGTTIDGFNYTKPGECLKIGTNSILPGKIVARTGVTIFGDVFVGPGGDPDVVIDSRNEAVITGETYALDEVFEMPPVTVPQYLQNLPSIGNITQYTVLTVPTRCESVDLQGELLVINGPVALYCTGDFSLDLLSRLEIVDANTNPDAHLSLYLGKEFTIKNSSAMNNATKDPRKLKIYGLDGCTDFQFQIDSVFYGAIYAPKAEVMLQNSVEIFGSILVRQFEQQVAANFHYDASLKAASVSDEMVNFVIRQWHEE
jgi:hypothetical protein